MDIIRAERHMKITCIGAGASGLCFAYKLQRSFDNFTLTIYEKSDKVGGVWVRNRYPGCACDYEAHNYTYSWEPKADWTSVYASAPEVQGYFEDFAKKHDLLRYCKFATTVTQAQWREEKGRWELRLESSETEYYDDCDILINASGLLHTHKWPDIEGLEEFEGVKVHTAAWPETPVKTSGRKVGLIGNGSSGQQILEAVQPHAGHLTVFIRQPTWVLGPFGQQPRRYTADEVQSFKDNPENLLTKRKEFERRVNSYFGFCLKDSVQQAALRSHLTQTIKNRLKGSQYNDEMFIPQYAVGCRRPTPGTKYIESLHAANVQLIMGDIKRIISDAVIDHEGTKHPLDVLVCATGFDTSHRPQFPIFGQDGKNLQDIWRSNASAYLALAVPEFPNYFVFYGPNNPFGSGAFLSTIEAQADYMLKWCDRWQTENVHSFAPKKVVVEEFETFLSEAMHKTVWADLCNSWYKSSKESAIVSLWPGSGLHYMEAISSVRGDDFEVRYNGNRWAWLGNGVSQVEKDPECDLAYYIRNEDKSELLSAKKRRRALAKGIHIDPETLHIIG
ncbi:FAD/NAD(P)-binding domain-containing protein [Hypoxylon trugodes]|uniref:FAD/NAD(P)-binding domain-containing protein n=1 Tax=Hypoxylon trugodes TaxID=326681 RepID=UPI00219FA87E|nr:FAD/NAD(P)-binding domain-containing protein [Hypoxylon trugodes]KAI1394479.1 FAD/NAD(P)-binding domain-containing protein [Hypoxylon trugodes]